MRGGPEPELYKDKIEISLDGRQVFYLFFGGAVIACLVFVLGVMVGRRVEARAHVDRGAPTTAARDPLTALDQLDARAREDMSFRSSLAGGKAGAGELDEAIAAIEAARAAAPPPAPAPAKKPEVKPEVKPEAAKPAAAPAPAAARPPEPAAKPAQASAPAPKPAAAPAPEDPAEGGKFTLQLSSFKEREEAEAFLWTMKHEGYKAYMVKAEVEGKGTFYRVRVGRYDSYQAALDAKAEFEKRIQKIAYVTRL